MAMKTKKTSKRKPWEESRGRRSLVESIIHDDDQGRIAIRPSADSRSADPSVIDKIRLEPSNVMHLVGMEPDLWQEEVLRSMARRVSSDIVAPSRLARRDQTPWNGVSAKLVRPLGAPRTVARDRAPAVVHFH